MRSIRQLHVLALFLCASCTTTSDGGASPDAAVPAWTLADADFGRPWIVLRVPCAANEWVEGLVRGADGFLAVVYENHSEGKVVQPGTYRLRTSSDGLGWSAAIIAQDTMDRWYQIAQAGGRMVIAGMRDSQHGLLGSSTDGKTWDIEQTATHGLRAVAHVNGRFFALGILGGLLVSEDGVTWHDRSQPTAQNNAVAFGNGRWVVAGNTSFFVSTDTVRWDPSGIECTDPATCPGATQPGWQPGDPVSIGVTGIFFANGAFHAGPFVSADGRSWASIADPAQAPADFVGDRFLRFTADGVVHGSTDGATWTVQTTLTDKNPGGHGCADNPCFPAVLPDVGRAIVLVPSP